MPWYRAQCSWKAFWVHAVAKPTSAGLPLAAAECAAAVHSWATGPDQGLRGWGCAERQRVWMVQVNVGGGLVHIWKLTDLQHLNVWMQSVGRSLR
jgi:hypothetical protein